MIDLSQEQFEKVARVVYQKLGLHFDTKKAFFISRRIEKRLVELGLDKVEDYLFQLTCCDGQGAEIQELANLITTNETYMFREFEQFEAFANHCLPEVLARKRLQASRQLRIWSAGCSSGEEPYTLAIILKEIWADIEDWDVEITGTDIDESVLATALRAEYRERSVRHVPNDYFERHLSRINGSYHVTPGTARLVSFRRVNLADRIEMRAMRNYDFIFCRNVLIYFDDDSRKAVVGHFFNALNPGGYLFLGHSESVSRISTAFRMKRFDKHIVYWKP